jgi:hypothetical protein
VQIGSELANVIGDLGRSTLKEAPKMTRKTIALIACCLISPAVAAAQTGGLTKVQLLALQQELKDQCGLQHATGVMDGPTRHAVAVCNKKYGTQGNGAALLAAMNVGFNPGDNAPQGGMGTVMGNDNDNDNDVTATGSTRTWTDSAGVVHTSRARGSRATGASRSAAGRARARARGGNANATGLNRGIIDRDAPLHGVDSTSGGPDVDGRTNDRKMAHDSAMAGMRDGRVRNPGQGKRTKAGRDSVKH